MGRRRRPNRDQLTISAWVETRGAHECDRLNDALQDGLYEVARAVMGNRRRMRLILLPLLPWPKSDLNPTTDRLRYCPFCGAQIKLVDAPKRLTRSRKLIIPDTLPKDVE
jgi:hypothetical protein